MGPVGSIPFPQLPLTEPGVRVALSSLPISLRFVLGVGWGGNTNHINFVSVSCLLNIK